MHADRQVVFVNRFYWPQLTGTAQMLTDLAEDLADDGWDVTIVTSRASYVGPQQQLAGVEYRHGVRIVRVGATWFARRGLAARLINYLSYTLGAFIHLMMMPRQAAVVAMTDPPLLSVIGLLAGRLRGWKVVYWVQDLYPHLAGALGVMSRTGPVYRVLDRAARAVNSRCDLVITLGPRMAESLMAAGARRDRTTVVPNWADTSMVHPVPRECNEFLRSHELKDKFVVMYSGNFGRAHTFDAVLGAMRELQDDSRIMFVFIGGGQRLPELRAAVAAAGLANVRFMDYVPREQLADSLSAADVALVTESDDVVGMLVPSKTYGILASGRPLLFVGSDRSDVAEIVRTSGAGFVIPGNEPARLARAIRDLSRDRAMREFMGRRSRLAAESLYDRRHATARWSSALAHVCTATRPREAVDIPVLQ